MQTIKQYIKNYFELNKEELGLVYPGLRFERILDEFIRYTGARADQLYLGEGSVFIKLVSDGMPFEYIQNNAFFYKTNFYVDENVLIPRSETEILVEDCVKYLRKYDKKDELKVCEIGTGSFCLGLSILCDLSFPISLWGSDICEKAISVSSVNLFRLRSRIHPKSSIYLTVNDKLKDVDKQFDLIVSNPPYIKELKDREGVHGQTHTHEPHLALYLKDEIFADWFRELFEQSSQCLVSNGIFMMEGHEDSLCELEIIAKEYFSDVKIKKDYTQRDRFLWAQK